MPAEKRKAKGPMKAKKASENAGREQKKPLAEKKAVKGKKGPTEASKPAKEKKADKKKPEAKPKKAKKNKQESQAMKFLREKPASAAGIAAIAIIAVALAVVSMPEEASVDDFWPDGSPTLEPGAQEPVKMFIVTSNRCQECENYTGNSFENLFKANGIEYAVQEIEESTPDGQSFIQTLDLNKLPAYIIQEESVSKNTLVKTKEGGMQPLEDVLHFYVSQGKGSFNDGLKVFGEKEEIFVFEEISLDGVIRPKLWLREQCGNETNVWVQMFVDPYDPHYIKRNKEVQTMLSIIGSEPGLKAKIQYIYLPTYSSRFVDQRMQETGESREDAKAYVGRTAAHLICAREHGYEAIKKMEREIYETYCGLTEEEYSSADPKVMEKCVDSSHYGEPLSIEELDKARFDAGLDTLEFKTCTYVTATTKLESMYDLAVNQGIARTPTFLVNCQYEVPYDKVPASICALNAGGGWSFC